MPGMCTSSGLMLPTDFNRIPKPQFSMPPLFEIAVKFLIPLWCMASIIFSGIPHKPKPPKRMRAPLASLFFISLVLILLISPIKGSFKESFNRLESKIIRRIERLEERFHK
uniref:Uncharacterized protein n=1 Tax=Glossina brevipalpis TaxID=37001 RepID=A0A1A9W7L2_9MUSC